MTTNNPWLYDFYSIPIPALLSREDFVKKYLPQYVRDYQAPTGIKMVKSAGGGMHVQVTTKGSFQAQLTKRENRISEAYSRYCSHHKAQAEMDRLST